MQLAGKTTFLYTDTYKHFGSAMASVTWCLVLKFKAEISIYKEEKINLAKPTVIEQLMETQTKRDICRSPEVKFDAFGTSKHGEGKSLSKIFFCYTYQHIWVI